MGMLERKVPGGLHVTSRIIPYNARAVLAALPREGRRAVYKIDGVDGLRLHVLPTRRRSGNGVGPKWEARWYVHYTLRTGSGKSVQHLIGSRDTMSLEEARATARQIIALVEDKKLDPRYHGRKGCTFNQLFADWLEGYAIPNLKEWQQPRDKLSRHALPLLGRMALPDIKAMHINDLLDRLVVAGKGTQANRVRAHLSAVFKWGLSRGYGLEYNPVQMTSRPKRREYPRTVVYDHSELRLLWRAIDQKTASFGEEVGLVLKLALVTGQRKGEIVGALVSELDLSGDRPVWKLPKERTKGAREQLVPLSPLAVSLFERALKLGLAGRTYVFPSAKRPRSDKHLAPRSVSQGLARARQQIGLARLQTVHDLRRTANTEMARLGIPADIRARVLNHSKKGVTDAVYNAWEYEPEKRNALNRWSAELLLIVNDHSAGLSQTRESHEEKSRVAA